MKMTLQEKANVLNTQYILEYLIEKYNDAKLESERYRIKLLLIDFVRETQTPLSEIRNYLNLDANKFKPFIDILANVIEEVQTPQQNDTQDTQPPYEEYTGMPSVCFVIKRQA